MLLINKQNIDQHFAEFKRATKFRGIGPGLLTPIPKKFSAPLADLLRGRTIGVPTWYWEKILTHYMMTEMGLSNLNGTLLAEGGLLNATDPVDGCDCVCGGPCPSNCDSLAAKKITVTGATGGCCCDVINVANLNLTRVGCKWTAANSTGSPTFAEVEYEVECIAGSPDQWRVRVLTVSAPPTCSPTCTTGFDTWDGFIDSGADPNGSYDLVVADANDCTGSTATAVVADQ